MTKWHQAKGTLKRYTRLVPRLKMLQIDGFSP